MVPPTPTDNLGRPHVLLLPVYRYLPTQFVDAFFETGELRISSFRQFSKHADEARYDPAEGKATIQIKGKGSTLIAGVARGQNSFVLSTSAILSRDVMDAFKGSDAVIAITNLREFALAIARQLPGYLSGSSDHCKYTGKTIVRHVDGDPFPQKAEDAAISRERLLAQIAEAGRGDEMFLKDPQYVNQAEYRLVWNVDREVPDHITINSLEAARFCRRIGAEELN